MQFFSRTTAYIPLTLLAILCMSVSPSWIAAQQTMTEETASPETITIQAGDVFEILTVAEADEASYSWVLTRDRTFLEAGLNRIFRFRPTEIGDYVLEGAVHVPSRAVRIRKTITLHVEERDPSVTLSFAGTDRLHVSPAAQNGVTTLARNRDILSLIPSPDVSGRLHIDFDTQTDTSGDGDPANDSDAGDALFGTEKNALHLWLSMERERMLRIAEENGPATELTVRTTSADATDGISDTIPRGEMSTTITDGNFVRFSFPLDTDENSLVYHWNFGDGTESLLHAPTHTYMQTGTFTVRASARDLRDGRTVMETESTIDIQRIGTVPSSTATSSRAASSSEGSITTPADSSGNLGFILRILALGLAAIAIGAVLTWLGSKILHRGQRLQKGLEDAEAKLLGKDVPSDSVDVPPPPMELKRPETEQAPVTPETDSDLPDLTLSDEDTSSDVVQNTPTPPPEPANPEPSATEQTSTPPASTEQYIDVNAAPPWLQASLAEQPTPPAPAPEPTPASSAPPPPTEVPVPAPAPEQKPDTTGTKPEPLPPPVPSAPIDMNAAPPWLQQGLAQATDTNPSPSPSPSPSPDPGPPPTDESVPPWLRPEAAAAEVAMPSSNVSANSAPVLETAPVPEPTPTPTPATPASPAETPIPAPEIPTAPAPETEPTLSNPAPEPTPVPASPATAQSEPAPMPVQEASPTPTSTAPLVTDAEQERAEKERERKRRKRQRYRENLRKRKETEQAVPSSAAVPAQATPPPDAPLPEIQAQPEPVSAPAPAPASSAPITPLTQEGLAQTAGTNPNPSPDPDPRPPSPDDIAFVIRADDVEPPKPTDTPSQQA